MDKSSQPNQSEGAQPASPQPTYIVQQVKTTRDLKSLGGWLMFFLVCFACVALSMLSISIFSIFTPDNAASSIVSAIFTPFIAVAALLSVVFIAFQFKLARITSIATYALSALWTSIITLVTIGESAHRVDGAVWGGAIVGIITSLVMYGLLVLYFFVSKRVKETLTKEISGKIKTIAISSALGFAAILAILGIIFSVTTKSKTTLDSSYDYDYDSLYDDDYLYY